MRQQRGFTLVELMVSLVIFSIAIAGILSVAVSMANNNREQRYAIAMEDNARAAMDFMGDAIRGSGPLISQNGKIFDEASCKTWDQSSTYMGGVCVGSAGDANCPSSNSTSSSDNLRVVFPSGGVVTSIRGSYNCNGAQNIQLTDATGLHVGDSLAIGDIVSNTVEIVTLTAVDTSTGIVAVNCTCTGTFTQSYAALSLAVRVVKAKFYVGTYDGASNVLLMQTGPKAFSDTQTTLTEEPLAENVEDFQVSYGLDNTYAGSASAGSANTWLYSSGTQAATGGLRAVRLTFVAKSPQALSGTNSSFLRPAAEDHPVATSNDKYRRRVLSSTIEIRNAGGSP
jgi:prepilin-type N-terminal cleavage/methylation domain-containing protein